MAEDCTATAQTTRKARPRPKARPKPAPRTAQKPAQKPAPFIWTDSFKETLRESIKARGIVGRDPETDSLVDFLFDQRQSTIYIHGKPGTGKSHLVKELSETLAEEGVEVYHYNLLLDKGFFPESDKAISNKIILVVDEFEGKTKERCYLKQKDALVKKMATTREPSSLVFKTIFISNVKCREGLHFKPYTKESMKAIICTKATGNTKDMLLRLHEGIEKTDIRATMQSRIETHSQPKDKDGPETPQSQYHQFVQRKVLEGVVDINMLYSEFIREMKKRDIIVIPKELLSDILETYING
ncbi:hypothetical protein NEDG_01837 [Nematocida displodere]|uniref:Uncharacterized protein n=1 Tax=Nematocida displodere TaxID=1805483 RepID=A0A177EK49_9MICR|nr:hypothetical protein NEDG_01837 [Nematocida displodere]